MPKRQPDVNKVVTKGVKAVIGQNRSSDGASKGSPARTFGGAFGAKKGH